jgi:hypothetical protein
MAADIVETSFLFFKDCCEAAAASSITSDLSNPREAIYSVTTSCFYVGYARRNH